MSPALDVVGRDVGMADQADLAGLPARLRAVVGEVHCVAPSPRGSDWLGRTRGPATALVRPSTTEQVSGLLRVCGAAGVPVVVVGGDTGLVGGTLPGPGPVVLLETGRLLGITVDPAAGTLLAGAGETVAAVQRAAHAAGWQYGVDLASRDSATIGGTVATNAGGMHVCAYGPTRGQLLGLESVLADGGVLTDLRGLPKDNTGFDITGLMCGSEGTLAVVTQVLVRLRRVSARLLTVATEVPTLAAAVRWGRSLARLGTPHACEVVDAYSWRRAGAALGLRDPVRPAGSGFVVVLELMDTDEDALTGVLADDATVVGADGPASRALWAIREGQTEWWARRRVEQSAQLAKFDVALPLSRLDEAVRDIGGVLTTDPHVAGWGVFGHLLEGSLHVQVLTTDGRGADHVYAVVDALGGTVSAEHGVGRDKAPLLALRRSPAELAAGRAIKAALDPAGLLNPGVIYD